MNLIEIFKNESLKTNKSFGQHFLTNSSILNLIVEKAEIVKEDNIIEIGPGCGVLTQLICETGADTTAVEIDKNMIEFLNRYFFFYDNFKIINEDATRLDFESIYPNKEVKIIGNLPYNLSIHILLNVSKREKVKSLIFMFQKEVADRINAVPNSKAYSSLSVIAKYFYKIEKIKDISGGNFYPNAKVYSTVLKFTPKSDRQFTHNSTKEEEFFAFLKDSFHLKRKTLKNNLSKIENISEIIKECGLKEAVRAEELSLDDFIKIFKEVKNGK